MLDSIAMPELLIVLVIAAMSLLVVVWPCRSHLPPNRVFSLAGGVRGDSIGEPYLALVRGVRAVARIDCAVVPSHNANPDVFCNSRKRLVGLRIWDEAIPD